MNCRVLGVVMARDEWPGLALSIVHALDHVETVLVIDHASIDGTAVGLEQLRSSFGDRLHVIRLDGVPYWQDAVVNLALAEFGTEEYEWIYPFDADEFLIVGPPSTLSELLDAVPHHCVAARYEVQNFVAPHDFDPSALAQYQRITHRSLPSQVVDVPPAILADDIAHGDVNFFDLHFDSKVIVRARRSPWICAGAHRAWSPDGDSETVLTASTVRAAHVPFSGRARLDERAANGRRLRDAGMPEHHGWQSQMLSRLADEDRLNDFWTAHSVGLEPPEGVIGPLVDIDMALAEACRSAADVASALPPAATAPAGALETIALEVSLGAIRAAQQSLTMLAERAASSREQLVVTRASAAAAAHRRDELQLRVNWLDEQLASQLQSMQQVRAELTDALSASDAHRADLSRELAAMRNTLVWRWSAPLRAVRHRLRFGK